VSALLRLTGRYVPILCHDVPSPLSQQDLDSPEQKRKKRKASMSLIFNESALLRLSTIDLEKLRQMLFQALAETLVKANNGIIITAYENKIA
jgi:hypothetical protein